MKTTLFTLCAFVLGLGLGSQAFAAETYYGSGKNGSICVLQVLKQDAAGVSFRLAFQDAVNGDQNVDSAVYNAKPYATSTVAAGVSIFRAKNVIVGGGQRMGNDSQDLVDVFLDASGSLLKVNYYRPGVMVLGNDYGSYANSCQNFARN